MASTLPDQALALAMGTASVFLFDRGHPHNGAQMALASVDRDESPQQGERIDPIGLHSAGPAIDLDACRIEDAAVDPDLGQRTRQPENVVTRFITDHNPLLLPRSLAQSADQISQIATGDPMNARPIPIRTSDGNDPALLAELDRRINRRLEPDTIVHACHFCRSPVVDAAILGGGSIGRPHRIFLLRRIWINAYSRGHKWRDKRDRLLADARAVITPNACGL